jgi:hypothetical protein
MRVTEREAFEAVRFLSCEPEIQAAPMLDHLLTIESMPGGYCVREPGVDDETVTGVKAVVDRVHSRLLTYSLSDQPRAGVLHAASLRRRGRRVLLAGTQAAGKTTLALRLVRAGYDLEGDEHVFLEDDGIVARPRACWVKEASLALLPEASDIVASAAVYVDEVGRRIFNIDPRMIGGSWRIEKGEAACVIVLEPNHGGHSSLRPISPLALAQALMSEIGMREIDRSASIRAVATFVSRTKGFALLLGDHESAVEWVDIALNISEGLAGSYEDFCRGYAVAGTPAICRTDFARRQNEPPMALLISESD